MVDLLSRFARKRVQIVGRSWPEVEKELQEFLDSLGQGTASLIKNDEAINAELEALIITVAEQPETEQDLLASRVFNHGAFMAGIPGLQGTPNKLAKFITPTSIGDAVPLSSVDSVAADGSTAFLTVLGTLPAVTTNTVIGQHNNIVSAGSSSNQQIATRSFLDVGYTGSAGTVGLLGQTAARGTGTNPLFAAGNLANYGLIGFSASGGGAGHNVGVYGESQSASGYGGFFEAGTTTAQGTHVGVAGFGMSVGGGHIRIGGHFGLITSAGTLPTFISAALVADNSGASDPIFLARDNGTTVFSIEDGGIVNVAGLTASKMVFSDSSKNLVSGDFATAENVLANAIFGQRF